MAKELVNHPDHYNRSGRRECWDEMIHLFSAEAVITFDCLSAYKYFYRCGEKEGNPTEQEQAKIATYLEHAKRIQQCYACDAVYANMIERTIMLVGLGEA